MTATFTPTTCIFCRVPGRKLTKEHLLPKAVRDAFPGLTTSKFYRHPGPAGQVQSWDAPSFAATVRVVCEECNNTWMSEVEKAASPLLGGMVRPSNPLVLDAYAQRRMAAWAFLKAVVDQYTGDGIVIPDSHVRELVTRHQPPLKSAIWMVAYNRPFGLTTFQASGGDFGAGRGEFYVVTSSVGTLAFHIFGHTSHDLYEHRIMGIESALLRIWPSSGLVTWPPPAYLEDTGIEQLHRSLQVNMTDEVRALREKGLAAYIRQRHSPPSS